MILLVVEDSDGDLQFLVHPNWRKIVQRDDLNYIESLLLDFPERARVHPRELMIQLSSLSVGPLVTLEAGQDFSDHPLLAEMCKDFLPF